LAPTVRQAAEIKMIEAYLPKAAGEEAIVAGVRAAIAEMTPPPAMKDMGKCDESGHGALRGPRG
jgi:uncharacterized protein YqeY